MALHVADEDYTPSITSKYPVESGTFPLIPTDLAKKKKLRGLFF